MAQSPAPQAQTPQTSQAAYGQRAGLPRHLQSILSLNDFEAAARKHLPRPLYGYVSGAAEDCVSLQANRDSFQQYGFSSRVMVDVSKRSQKVELFGQTWDSPFGVAPGTHLSVWHPWASAPSTLTGVIWCWPKRQRPTAFPPS